MATDAQALAPVRGGEARGDLVLAIDQGTSSTKCLLVGSSGVLAVASAPLATRYPAPGWVEQDADEILVSVLHAAQQCLSGLGDDATRRIAGVGLSTQRESVLLWDTATCRPVSPVLGWQDRRTQPICTLVRADPRSSQVRRISGLPVDPMFSAAKVRWLLDEYDPDRRLSRAGALALGTVDAWLMHSLVGDNGGNSGNGESSHRIEAGNASRTQLLEIRTTTWSPELLDLFGIPSRILPDVVPSSGDLGVMGRCAGALVGMPLRAVLGDSHAALLAHGAQALGAAKVTYGTGSSVMRLVDSAEEVPQEVCLTIAWAGAEAQLAAEGNIRSTGATLAWLGRLVGLPPAALADAAATSDNGGVHVVPAFGGLAAPWWDDGAVGLLSGLTLGTDVGHLARAAVESIAFQVDDVVRRMAVTAGPVTHLVADGGGSSNSVLMQIQADLAGVPVRRARDENLSALGAAHLAGRSAGLWREAPVALAYDEFTPQQSPSVADGVVADWHDALDRARSRPTTTLIPDANTAAQPRRPR